MSKVFLTTVTLITVVTHVMLSISDRNTTETKAFCAYNRVFVEFKQGNSVWGSLMLDYNGHPIPCSDLDEVDEHTSYRTSI